MLTENLFTDARRFEFFQAVRLLEWISRERAADTSPEKRFPIGLDYAPAREVVRFKVLPELGFPESAIAKLVHRTDDRGDDAIPEMLVTFMGLIGPQGVLPQHYTEYVMKRLHDRDRSLYDFLNLFHHRTISLFYRAWEKYRVPVALERARVETERSDQFTDSLRALVGIGFEGLQKRLDIDDDVLLRFSGFFAHRPRNAVSLQALLTEHFRLPVRIEPFQGRWLGVARDEQTRLPGSSGSAGQYCGLGRTAIVGERVWDVQSKFRLCAGPVSYACFRRLMPGSEMFRAFCDLTRIYIDPALDFELQVTLEAEEVPRSRCRLGGDPTSASLLGWNTWLTGSAFETDADDAVFRAVS